MCNRRRTRRVTESARLLRKKFVGTLEGTLGLNPCRESGKQIVDVSRGKEESNMEILTFILFLIVAAACAYLAEVLVPGTIPGGFFTSAIVGIIGAWVGSSLMGSFGPSLAGVALIPCILGSAILVFCLGLISRGLPKRV